MEVARLHLSQNALSQKRIWMYDSWLLSVPQETKQRDFIVSNRIIKIQIKSEKGSGIIFLKDCFGGAGWVFGVAWWVFGFPGGVFCVAGGIRCVWLKV